MSFLRNFSTWTSGTEVPENYLFWAGISSVSACLASRVWTRMGRFTIYPNVYIIFLGPPGNGKTVAKDLALKIVREVGGIKMSAEAQTKEALCKFMREECIQTYTYNGAVIPCTPISIYLTEFSHFLGPNSSHMLDFLTTIWDRTGDVYDARTKNKGDDILPSPYVNLLACTTPDWIRTYLKSDIITGGFSRRAIFVNEPANDDGKRIPRPEWTAEQTAARNAAIEYGRTLATLVGELAWSGPAVDFWDTWYTTRVIPQDPDTRGYHKSKPALLLKVATIVALSERPELRIDREHMETALAILDSTEATLSRVFQGIGRNELNGVASKLLDNIKDFGKRTEYELNGKHSAAVMLPEAVLKGMMFRDGTGSEYNEVISHLTAIGKIEKRGLPPRVAGQPTRVMILLRESGPV